jgi:hypothetical protein
MHIVIMRERTSTCYQTNVEPTTEILIFREIQLVEGDILC